MAGSDPQKQLLNLIRNYASEKSEGERRLFGLKKRLDELRSELHAANAELEDAKRVKETAEQELKGYEVELALNEATIQTLEARISLIQEEISTIGTDLEALKDKEEALRDEFISQMFELNTTIRKFQELISCNVRQENLVGVAAETKEVCNVSSAEQKQEKEVGGVALKTLEDELARVISQTTKEEEEYQAEQKFQRQVQQELTDYEKKVFLMDGIVEVTKVLEGITKTSELELTCASLGEELQRRCICPSCHLDNVEALEDFFRQMRQNDPL